MSKIVLAQVAISQRKLAVIFGFKPISKFIECDYSIYRLEHFPPRPHKSHRKFTLFSQLPRELQVIVWKYFLIDCEPRPIVVKSTNICAVLPGKEFETPVLYQAKAYCDIPPILNVCRLARTEALRSYSLNFQENLIHPVYFDPLKDYLIAEGNKAWESFVDHGLTHDRSSHGRQSRLTKILSENDWRGFEFL